MVRTRQGNGRETSLLGGAPSPFPGDDLVAGRHIGMGPNEQGLQDAPGADGCGEIGEAVEADGGARLKGARFEGMNVDFAGRHGRLLRANIPEQGGKTTTEPRVLFPHLGRHLLAIAGTADELGGEAGIGLCTRRFDVIQEHWFPMAGGFGHADISGNDGFVDA